MKSERRNEVIKENPRVFCKDKSAEVMAHYTQGKQVAVAIKKQANGSTAVFCGMPIQDSEVWAALFKRAGIHRYVNDKSVSVMGNERYLIVHTAKQGAYEIKLPRKAKQVKDLFSGKILAKDKKDFIVRDNCGMTYFMEITY
jgi:hypothetical protein